MFRRYDNYTFLGKHLLQNYKILSDKGAKRVSLAATHHFADKESGPER